MFQNCKKTACSSYVQPWLVAIGGWQLAVVGDWQLAVSGGWWWLAAVGGWRLVVGGGWWLAAGGWCLAVGGGWWLTGGDSWRLVAVGGWWLVVPGGGPQGRCFAKKNCGFLKDPPGLVPNRQLLASNYSRLAATRPTEEGPSGPSFG